MLTMGILSSLRLIERFQLLNQLLTYVKTESNHSSEIERRDFPSLLLKVRQFSLSSF